jgi:hypothetical protein
MPKDRVHKVRKDRIRDPKGNWLTATLVHVLERDDKGRATSCRIYYDDEDVKVGDLSGPENKKVEFLVVWMTGAQLSGSKEKPS